MARSKTLEEKLKKRKEKRAEVAKVVKPGNQDDSSKYLSKIDLNRFQAIDYR